jgi:SAM-dependent methyltransferase
MAETQHAHWWYKARREILERLIAGLNLPEGARLLEIGSGTGGNLAMLARFGEVCAVENDAYARRHASEISGISVRGGSLPDALPFDDGSFDLVCLFDVLEHVENDAAALERVCRLLKPGGRAVVTVPAYQWLYGAHDRAHHHFRRYTARRLRAMARGAGLRVAKCGYFNTLLFPAIALRRLQQIVTGGHDGHDAALPNRLVNGILYAIFSAEKHVVGLRLFPYGTSVLAVLVRDR